MVLLRAPIILCSCPCHTTYLSYIPCHHFIVHYMLCISLGASLIAQLVKNPRAMWETWVRSLDWEDLLEESLTTHSNTLAWRIPMDRGAWQATVHGIAKSWTWQNNWAYSTAWIKRHATPKLEEVPFCHCTMRNATYLTLRTKCLCLSKMHMMKPYLHNDIWRCKAFGGIRFREHC